MSRTCSPSWAWSAGPKPPPLPLASTSDRPKRRGATPRVLERERSERDASVAERPLESGTFEPGLFEAARMGLDAEDLGQFEQGDVVPDLTGQDGGNGVGIRARGDVLLELPAAPQHLVERPALGGADHDGAALPEGGVQKLGVH